VASKIQFSSGVSINIAGGKAAVKMSKESVQQIVTTGIHIKKNESCSSYLQENKSILSTVVSYAHV